MAAPPELIAALTRLGFSQYEAQAYAALAGQRPMNGSEVSKRAGMPPSKVYETLARLEAKGAVLVSRSEPIRYSAVPHADVLASLRARFNADLGTATAALDQLPAGDEPGLVWSLHDKDAIDRAFVRVITAARTGIFAGVWDEELDQLGPHLEAASQRGIETHVAIYGKRTLTGPRTYDLGECGASARLRLSGRRLAVVVADDSDTAVAEFGDRTPDEAVLTTNRVASLLAVEYVKADISGRLLINALGETAYQRLLATPDMRAVMATVEPRNPRLAPWASRADQYKPWAGSGAAALFARYNLLDVRRLVRATCAAGVALMAALAAAGCSAAHARAPGAPSIAVPAAYVQLPSGQNTTVGYLDIRNNGGADRLVSVRTSVGGTVELRAPVRPGKTPIVFHTVADIPIAANAMTQLIPDSYHLLISGAGPMQDGKDITLKLTFARSGTITILALVTNPQSGGSSYFLN